MSKVTIIEKRVGVDYSYNRQGQPDKPGAVEIRYILIRDGKRIDSFMNKARAQQRADDLNTRPAESTAGDGQEE